MLSEHLYKYGREVPAFRSLEAAYCDRVRDELDETRGCRSHNDIVGFHPELKVELSEDGLYNFYQLNCESLLSKIVPAFNYVRPHLQAFEVAEL